MNGCIYRTKDGECELWEKDRNHSPFCNPNCDHKHPSNADWIRGMTDEELAELLTAVAQKSANKLCERLKTVEVDLSNCIFHLLYEAHLDWLKEEVK